MQPGIPGSAPPSTYAAGGNALGPVSGSQANARWGLAETDERPLLSCMRAPHLWRVTLHGENVTFRVSWGTSSNIIVAGVQPPARFTVPGSVDVYAKPNRYGQEKLCHAEVTCTPASSGSSAVMRVGTGIGPVPLDANAVRFTAVVASVVGVGPGLSQQNVPLAINETTMLTAGSILVSGAGYLEFEP